MSAEKPAIPPSLRRRIGFWSLLLAVQAVLTFGVLELACRIFDPLGISYYPHTAAYIGTLIVEEPIGYRNRPGLAGRFYGAPVSINSLGLRDREIPPRPEADEYRIAVFGDSFMFGIGVDDEHTIPYLLEQTLARAAAGTGVKIRTVNFGTISYNTEQELIQLETLGMKLEPSLVVLLYMQNDIEPKTWILDKRSRWYVRAVQRSYAASLLALLYRKTTGLGPVGRVADDYREDNPRWKIADRSLTEIHATCRSAGIPLVVFTLRANELVEGVGAREGFPVISLLDDPYWEDNGKRPVDYANSATDSHPNAEGSRVYADLIGSHLIELGMVPVGTAPASRVAGE